MGSKESLIVNMDYEEEQGEDVWQLVDFFVHKIKNEVARLVQETRDKRIVLVGWRLSSYFNHRVVTLTNGVSAIIDLAFPINSGAGYRREPDDEILLTYCPSLFIMGSGADDFNAIALKEMRVNMISDSGSLILHRANNHLYVPTDILNLYGITMGTVYRGIFEHIVKFLKLSLTKRDRSQLIRGDLNSIYDVELFALVHLAAAEIQPQRITQQGDTTDGRPNAPRQLKRKIQMAESPEKTEYRFYEVLQTAQIANAASLPSLVVPKEEPEQ